MTVPFEPIPFIVDYIYPNMNIHDFKYAHKRLSPL